MLNYTLKTLIILCLYFGGLIYITPSFVNGEPRVPVLYIFLADACMLVLGLIVLVKILNPKLRYINTIPFFYFFFILSSFIFSYFLFAQIDFLDYIHNFCRNIIFYNSIGLLIFLALQHIKKSDIEIMFKKISYYYFNLTALLFIISLLNDQIFFFWPGGRYFGFSLNPNNLGFICLVFLIIGASLNFFRPYHILMSFGLIFSSGSIAAMLSCLVFLLIYYRNIYFYIFSALAVIFSLQFDNHLVLKIRSIISGSGSTSFQDRYDQLIEIISNSFESLFIFVGWDSHIFIKFDSSFYQILANLGIIPLLFLFAFFCSLFMSVRSGWFRVGLVLLILNLGATNFLMRWNVIIPFMFAMGCIYRFYNARDLSKAPVDVL